MENGLYKMSTSSVQETDNRGSRLVTNTLPRKESQCSMSEATFKMELNYHSRRDSDSIKILRSAVPKALMTIRLSISWESK